MIQKKNNSEDYLIHYGVLGMKWGVRKKKSSNNSFNNYKSRKTKKLERKSSKAMLKSNNLKKFSENKAYNKKERDNFARNSAKQDSKAKKLHGQAVASAKRDKRMIKEYNQATTGKKLVNALVAGPIGHTYVSSMKASGISRGKALAMSSLTGAIGAAYYRNKNIKSEGKKYENTYVNNGYYERKKFK